MPLLNVTELAKLTGKHRATLGKRLKEESYEDGPNGDRLYETRRVLGLIYREDFVGKKVDAGEDVLDLQEERARLAHHQANKYHLESENLKGNLIEADIVRDVWEGQLSSMRAKLLAIPAKAAPRLAIIEAEHEAQVYIETLIHESLTELSSYESEQYRRKGSKTGTLSAVPTAETDSEPVGGRPPKAKRRSKRGAGAVGDSPG